MSTIPIRSVVLNEMPWMGTDITIPTIPTMRNPKGRLVQIDRVDLRLEDQKRYGGVPIKDVYQWLAPLPWLGDGLFLTHDHGVIDHGQVNSIGASNWTILPDDWWEYATGNYNDRMVKAPKYPRGEEPTQDDLDNAEKDEQETKPTQSSLPVGDTSRPSRVSIENESRQRANYRQHLRTVLCRPF